MPRFTIRTMGAVTAALLLPGLAANAGAASAGEYFQKLEAGEITAFGGNPEGNAEGTIPPYNCPEDGGIHPSLGSEEAVMSGGNPYGNPYADEEPRLVITADNYRQYADKLTPGQMALFEQYGNDYKMKVYPTHRTYCPDQQVIEQLHKNVRKAELANGGTGINGSWMASPFPLPDNGLQAIWNLLVPHRAWREYTYYDQRVVYSDGSVAKGRVEYDQYSWLNDPSVGREAFWNKEKPIQSGFMNGILLPERERGTINLGREYMHKIEHRRQTWQYLPGTRRVRRFPHFGYDIPTGPGGLRGVDEDRIFNGSPHKWNWEYKGKTVKYVPYNNYGIDADDLTYDEVLGKVSVNPDLVRWELHRVHKLVATLKKDYRHWYNKRVIWLDEDSWHALLGDNYDNRGELWRTNWTGHLWFPSCDCLHARVAAYHDLQARAYVADRLVNEVPDSKKMKMNHAHHEGGELQFYSPANLRMLGRR